ncbi:outer membrane receptor protein involved in Fe transport [Sphingomonas sp. BK036]|nr:outer membrane receptor protein involved in Fe transport [Sphingomonas sp. BK036]
MCWSAAAISQSGRPSTVPATAEAETGPLQDRSEASEAHPDIVIVGKRGQVDTAIQPLATLDAGVITATGVTSIAELLRTIRGVIQSGDGQDPIFLLNAQRVSGYQEIGNLPPEAIEKVEVFPEPVALQYGYPPTRRIVNFTTKRRFRQLSLKQAVGTSTRGGADTANAHIDYTRLQGNGRLTLSLDARHSDALLQTRRRVLPDPDVPFDAHGNITGTLPGGEIDPALPALAGQFVTIVTVPNAPLQVGSANLGSFVAAANRPRLFDLSPLHTLAPSNDTLHGEAVLANRIGRGLSGSLTLTADHSRERTVFGPASAALVIPGDNPFSPFSRDVLLQRYLVEVPPLRQRTDITTLHAGSVVRGAWRGWQWDWTGTLDTQYKAGIVGKAIDTTAVTAAIAAGSDPFQPFDDALLAIRLVDRTVQSTYGAGTKFVATNRPLRLPAGRITLTATVEGGQVGTDSRTRGATPSAAAFDRSRIEGAVAFDLPIASRRENVLPWVGELSASVSATVRHVGGFGDLSDSTLGANWAPFAGLQLLAQIKRSAPAPTLDQLAAPQISAPQVPLFDFGTGRSTLVTVFVGGNPALSAEHRQTRSIGVTVKPFAKSELRIGASYETTDIRDGIQTIFAITPAAQAALPNLFARDGNGALVSVAFRPINIFRERKRTLNVTLAANGQLGRARPATTPGGRPPDRPTFYGGIGPTVRFVDRVELRPGSPTLDLLEGDTLSGGTTQRLAGYGYGGLSYLGNGGTFDFYCTGGATVRGGSAPTSLKFAPLCKINVTGSLSIHHFLLRQNWTRQLGLKLEVVNITDSRQRVRDANGVVPYRYQPDLLDALGRSVVLSLRKLF